MYNNYIYFILPHSYFRIATGCNTVNLIINLKSKLMSETKTYVFGQDANNSVLNTLIPLLNQRGIDANTILALQNGNGFGANNGSAFIWILFLLILFGRNCNGFGWGNGDGNGTAYLSNMMNNDAGRQCLEQLIQGNSSKLSELSSMLNCDSKSIQSALCTINNSIAQVGNQVGMSGMQTINAIQAGNANIAAQIAQCCCEQRLTTCQQTNTLQQAINNVNIGQERGFSNLAFESQRQTCELRDAIRENTAQVLAGQRSAELREYQRELAERDRKIAEQAVVINNGQQTAVFGQMIQQATAPIAGAVATLQGDVNNIKCKLPETATIPYSPVVGVPSCVAAQYGLGFGLWNNFGQWG